MIEEPKPKHRKIYRRPYGPHIRPALTKYTSLIGEVTWASNNLHAELLLMLECIFPNEQKEKRGIFSDNRKTAYELWHSLKSDDAQRAALRAVVNHTTRLNARNRKSLLWVIDSAGRLSEYRNDAIHTAFELVWDDHYSFNPRNFKFLPSEAANPKRVEKLERVGHTKLFKALIGDLNLLYGYCEAIWINSLSGFEDAPPALPKRPVLRSVLLVQKSPPKTNNPTKPRPKRKRQRRASPGK